MRTSIFGAAAGIALLAGCSMAPLEPPNLTTKLMTPTAQSGPAGGTAVRSATGSDPNVIIQDPEVLPVLPPIEGSPETRAPYVYNPGPSAPSNQFSHPLNSGPVTGYGPGGLAQPPGAPSNPPFHYVP
jgi:hypothetical protein